MTPGSNVIGRIATRSLVFVMTAALAAGCPSKHPRTVSDAGETDAGAVRAIGSACRTNADCASQVCDGQPPNGYCTAECETNADCPDGSVCYAVSDQPGSSVSFESVTEGFAMCVQLCQSNADCQPGYACEPEWDICIAGPGGCTPDAGCPETQACDPNSGFCSGGAVRDAGIGAPCVQPDDCSAGAEPFCLTADAGYPGGYCTSDCNTSDDCAGNPCVLSDEGSLCAQGCEQSGDCRAQYNCVAGDGGSYCLNFCQGDWACPVYGQTCDLDSGLCSGLGTAPLDAGTPVQCPTIGDAGSETGSEGMDGGTLCAATAPSCSPGGVCVDGFCQFPGDAGPDNDAGYPALLPPSPPQVATMGGPVLASPRFVPIFFSNDDPSDVQQIEQFDSMIGSTSYWATVGAEYGVGAATSVAPVQVPDIATGTIDDSQIGPWLEAHITSGALATPDFDTVYVLHYPVSMTITFEGYASCLYFGGYHNTYQLTDGTQVVYAVLPRCPAEYPFSTTLDYETGAESHEMFEASTDPYYSTAPAYSNLAGADYPWAYVYGGGELGDMCAQSLGAFTQFPGLPFTVQRMWSNKSMAAGHDPCIPIPDGDVYFNAAPVMTDMLDAEGSGNPTWLGVFVTGCTPTTIPIQLYSDGPTYGPWQVYVGDVFAFGSYDTVEGFSFSLDRSSGQNGDVLNLTIEANAVQPGTFEVFEVISTLGGVQHVWAGAVAQ